MASSTTLFLVLNILFFTMVTSTYVPCPPPPAKTPKTLKHPKTPETPKTPKTPKTPETPKTPTAPEIPKTPKTPQTPKSPSPVGPRPKATCPRDTLKLGVCANLLNDLVSIVVGTTPSSKTQCCSLIGGLTDLEAAVCLCTAVKASVLGINLNVPISLSLILNSCGKKVPSGFQCA